MRVISTFPDHFIHMRNLPPVQTMTSGCDNLPKETLVFRECVHISELRHPSDRYIGHFSKKESLSRHAVSQQLLIKHHLTQRNGFIFQSASSGAFYVPS